MGKLFMGIDTGTQGVRVGVCDMRGKIKASCEYKWEIIYPQIGWAEQKPLVWWENIKKAIGSCMEKLTAEERMDIAACAVCATSSTAFPVDEDGMPLMNALMWMDARSKEEMEEINRTGHRVLQYCGGAVSFEWLIPKVLWIKKHEPEIYRKASRIVEQLDWINFCLSGVWAASKCNASCKWNYSDSIGGFSEDFFSAIGLADYKEKIITDIRKMGEKVGRIRPELAEEFGLSPDLEVIEGGIDAHTALFGMNAFGEKKMGIIMGTSFVHLSQVSAEQPDISGIWGPYDSPLEDGKWLLEGGQITASGLVNWFRENFHTPVAENGDPYQPLDEAVRSVQPGAEGLTVLDFFQGNRTPYKDADAKGVIYGLNIKHTWKHIYRALLEGISFGTRNIIENQIRQGYDVDLIIGCGGVNKNEYWMQMMADITGKTIAVNEENQAGVLGDCILAAVGAGAFASFQEAADAMVRIKKFYEPDMEQHRLYEKAYQQYLGLYQDLKQRMQMS